MSTPMHQDTSRYGTKKVVDLISHNRAEDWKVSMMHCCNMEVYLSLTFWQSIEFHNLTIFTSAELPLLTAIGLFTFLKSAVEQGIYLSLVREIYQNTFSDSNSSFCKISPFILSHLDYVCRHLDHIFHTCSYLSLQVFFFFFFLKWMFHKKIFLGNCKYILKNVSSTCVLYFIKFLLPFRAS